MSPYVTAEGIRYRCDWLTCNKKFKTVDEALHHLKHVHYRAIAGCPVCTAMDKKQ